MIYLYGFGLSLLFGGMIAFQVLFAPLVFTQLPMVTARAFIRRFFPFYYLYFGILCALVTTVALATAIDWKATTLALSTLGFVLARQVLMPAANNATDSGNTARFNLMHRATVTINTLQLIAVGVCSFALFQSSGVMT